ncbi:hypothetical protein [Chryseobacterium sp. WLY505]|uniref:hypothetical protein n=1 Tax=Chryseobacterium sp. WLY505 TaxID=3068892 RepID=UPI002796C896|nr:hypothetical protein [Chryseobacterium sp. WLY505]MDQ1857619.1 hypothetical protein [Chryseobacterium sp. WLY505]
MNNLEKLNNLIINENAYFYHNSDNIYISDYRIKNLFALVSSVKSGHYLLNERKKKIQSEEIHYSICVFKYITKPTFIEEHIKNWFEEKLAYLLIVEIEDFIVISRKNISKIQDFTKLLHPLDYEVLSTLFIEDNTSFEKFSLKNLNVSDKALREKTVEAIDLKENFSSLGANNYLLSSLRISNNNEKTTLMLNSSRINKFGKKNSIENFCKWSKEQVSKIKDHSVTSTFLSIFAEPQNYEEQRESLTPISILFNFSSIYNEVEQGLISKFILIKKLENGEEIETEIKLTSFLNRFERLCKVQETNDDNTYKILNPISSDLELKLNEKSITVRSLKFKNIRIIYSNGNNVSIVDYINNKNSFIINFDNIDLAYSNRKLFRDNKLLGNVENFLKIFKPNQQLINVTSEKGKPATTARFFEEESIFRFVEDTFFDNYNYAICDDLGREWADHICVSDDKIAFIHSKFNTSLASASAFQDIVGQAQKNLGNITPQDFQLDTKKNLWINNYSSTNISRLRKGNSVDEFIQAIKNTSTNPYLKKEVILVINFISKNSLEIFLNNLISENRFTERSEAIQILWLISSLISSCQELNTEVTIYCRP